MSRGNKKIIVFVATTPFAINAFLKNHLLALSEFFDVRLIVNTGLYPICESLKNQIQVTNINMHREISILKDIQALRDLVRLLIEISPSSVHSITPKAGLLSMLAAWFSRVPSRYHTFTGQVWVTKKGAARWILKFFDRIIILFSTRVFADSISQSNFLIREGIVSDGEISVLGPGSIAGVDLIRFQPNLVIRNSVRVTSGVPENGFVFLFVGRLTSDKGINDLLSAFKNVRQHNSFVELWIVGPDEEGMASSIQKSSNELQGVIKLFKQTSQPELFMAAADVLILPSYREGFGTVVIEAAACGIPTLAYKIDGIIDAVEDGKTGILVNLGEVEKLSKAMSRIAIDKNFLANLGQNARKRAIDKFSSQVVTQAWINFYLAKLQLQA